MPRRYYALLALITLAAACLRLWRLTEVPPGLHYDLAATALLGNEVAFNGYRPIFITAYTGHETLFYYWLAAWFRLAGSSIFTLRLAAATLGILAVPAAWFALRELGRLLDEDAAAPNAALGAALLATAFFHVTFSRFGFRVITEPVVQSLALGFLFRGLRLLPSLSFIHLPRVSQRGHPSSFVQRIASAFKSNGFLNLLLAGAFTGLAAYTYLAARLFPAPLAILWLALLIGAWRAGRFKAAATGFATFALSALVVFAPLALYFFQHPADFLNRAGQVVPRPGETGLLLLGLRRAAEMVFIHGEPYDRFNVPGLPLLSPVVGVFFLLGLFLSLRDVLAWRTHSPTSGSRYVQTSVHLLLLAWVPLLLLPTALSVHDVFPSNVRAFGLIPLLFFFPARGLVAAYRALQRRLPGPLLPTAYPMAWLTLLVLALGTGYTARLYFREWANLPNQRLNNDADLTAIAAYLNATDLAGTSVYVSTIHYRHPTFAYLLEDFQSVRWLTGGTSLAVPAEGAALYVFARSTPPPAGWLDAWAPHLVAAPLDPDGEPAFRAYRFEAGTMPPLPVLSPAGDNFANSATLTGYRVLTTTSEVALDLEWRIENPAPAGDFLPHARLDDAWGQAWAQSGGFSYPSEQWAPGDTLRTRLTVPLPAGLPPGDYSLKVGLYSAGTDTLLARLSPTGEYAGNRVALPPLALAGPPVSLEQFQAAHTFAPPQSARGFYLPPTLLGYSLPRAALRQGEPFDLALYWYAADAVTVPEALAQGVQVTLGGRHLPIGERTGAQVLYAGQPVRGQLPFDRWQPGQAIVDRYVLSVPAHFAPGEHELAVNLPGVGSAVLATLNIVAVERQVSPPAAAVTLDADFGGLIILHGYTLTPGPTTALSLAWRSLAHTDQRYSVFVHVLDAQGQLVAQADAEPQQGRYPTPLWQPGEYVVDDYAFSLAPGAYTVRLGLYLPETGERLPVAGGNTVVLPSFEVP